MKQNLVESIGLATFRGHSAILRDRLYKNLQRGTGSRHGNCSDWIRENRRRRSCGLPQKRVLKINGDIFDPMNRTVEHTLSDGVVEVLHV